MESSVLVLGFLFKLLCGQEGFVRTSSVEVMAEGVLGGGAFFRQVSEGHVLHDAGL